MEGLSFDELKISVEVDQNEEREEKGEKEIDQFEIHLVGRELLVPSRFWLNEEHGNLSFHIESLAIAEGNVPVMFNLVVRQRVMVQLAASDLNASACQLNLLFAGKIGLVDFGPRAIRVQKGKDGQSVCLVTNNGEIHDSRGVFIFHEAKFGEVDQIRG
jgi:hypothetical protein